MCCDEESQRVRGRLPRERFSRRIRGRLCLQKSRRMLSMLLLTGSAVFGSGIATIFLRRSWSRDRYASRYHLASED